MRKRGNLFLTFILFLFLSAAFILFANTRIIRTIQDTLLLAATPFQVLGGRLSYSLSESFYPKKVEELEKDRSELVKKLVDQTNLLRENKALKDQFETQEVKSENLLAANIVGAPEFIPGVSAPSQLIIDKGRDQNVHKGEAVIYKNHIIGIISKVSSRISVVNLVYNKSITFTAKTIPLDPKRESAVGVVKGMGDQQIVLDNVILSETIKKSDLVVTSGSINEKKEGLPPNLIVGKIVSIEKKPSALFQIAQVKSFLDPIRLSTVFVVISN